MTQPDRGRRKMNSSDNQPWDNPRWVTSRHNFAPEIAIPPRPVRLHDLTLRDGEESADLAFTTADKIRIAEKLARLGIKRTEIFLTVPGWEEVIRAFTARDLGMDLWVTWQPGRVEKALDLGTRHVMVWHHIGDDFQKHVFGTNRTEFLDKTLAEIRAAKAAGCTVNLFMPESTRGDLDNIMAVAKAAEAEGADAVTVVDSQGIARPAAIAFLVGKLKAETKMEVEVHCHNDFGLAVANVLGGYEGGADVLQVSVNGIGYRAGNAAMETVAAALAMVYGAETGVDLTRLPDICREVAEISGVPNGYYSPIVGEGAFRYEQWRSIRAFEDAGERRQGFPFEPEVVGRSPELVIGKWSDTGAVIQKLADYALTATPNQLLRILKRSQRAGTARHRPLEDHEFLVIAEEEGAVDKA